jgi:hypothetical protein
MARGERMDYGIAIDPLLFRTKRATVLANSAPTLQLKRGAPNERVVALALGSGGHP